VLALRAPQLDLSEYVNDDNQIRLVKARDALKRGILSKEDLVNLYRTWRDQVEFMVLYRHTWNYNLEYKAIKCSKRGNDIYNWRINQRFKELDELAELYGDRKIFDINEVNPTTNCLYVTFTYDTKLCSETEAWKKISSEYNLAITKLRKKFGKISILRVWESFKNGYPHIHAILLFDEERFDVFEHWSSSNKSSYRIQEKGEFSKVWHSNVDVMAVDSVRGVVKYLSKYLRKVHSGNEKHDLTLAKLWIHHKQAFAMSRDFAEKISHIRLDSSLHNSNQPQNQTNLEGEIIENKWKCLGIFSKKEILKVSDSSNNEAWVLRLKRPPEKKTKLADFDKRIARELYSANLGVNLTSTVFHSPRSQEGKRGRVSTLRGLNPLITNCKTGSENLIFFKTLLEWVFAYHTQRGASAENSMKEISFGY